MSDCMSPICGMAGELCSSCAKDKRIKELEQRLEIEPGGHDGIYCRNETIKLLSEENQRLKDAIWDYLEGGSSKDELRSHGEKSAWEKASDMATADLKGFKKAFLLAENMRLKDRIAELEAEDQKAAKLIADSATSLAKRYAEIEQLEAENQRLKAAPAPDDPKPESERLAQLIAHRACCGTEHDPAQGKLHGCCVVCGVPWPCEYAGKPPAPDDELEFKAKVFDAMCDVGLIQFDPRIENHCYSVWGFGAWHHNQDIFKAIAQAMEPPTIGIVKAAPAPDDGQRECEWAKIDGMRRFKTKCGTISHTAYITPFCYNCGGKVRLRENQHE